ncbi:MAG: hypothetical protein K2H01_00480 [Ruminococcus sp.]|nr:hypothetical protein [Ruminococcus sp.]
MNSKSTKSERKEDRIQCLEREIANLKKKNTELQQQKTVRLNDEQLQGFLDKLTQRIEGSTNRIVDETPRLITVQSQQQQENDGFSVLIKFIIASLFFAVAIVIAYSLYRAWGELWSAGWISRIVLFIVAIAGFDSFVLGVEILKEKDRNYIVSLFSALVALVALIVTLVK